jgi:monoamine oxidase
VDFGPALTRPFGAVHWAGTETAGYWNGYMDGAVSSGERAAREVLARRRS